jgi:hypothetical protein
MSVFALSQLAVTLLLALRRLQRGDDGIEHSLRVIAQRCDVHPFRGGQLSRERLPRIEDFVAVFRDEE